MSILHNRSLLYLFPPLTFWSPPSAWCAIVRSAQTVPRGRFKRIKLFPNPYPHRYQHGGKGWHKAKEREAERKRDKYEGCCWMRNLGVVWLLAGGGGVGGEKRSFRSFLASLRPFR